MTLALLLADTLRSRAYVQALANAGIRADRALVVESPDAPRWGHTEDVILGGVSDLFTPDLTRPLLDDVRAQVEDPEVSKAGTVNDDSVVQWLETWQPDLVLFSGFGGEIVREPVLAAGAPLLHMHSGWLPDYRGSTTLYYSYLAERRCGVSALLLEPEIDTGPIVGRKWYPPPAADVDVDYLYDASIRADLLVEVVSEWHRAGGRFPNVMPQPREGRTYYIIHPILKHIALSSIKRV